MKNLQLPEVASNAQPAGGDAASILAFGDKLWAVAERLHGSMGASDRRHVVLGLIVLRFLSEEAHWSILQANSSPSAIDRAIEAIERETPSLKGVLPRLDVLIQFDMATLSELVDLLATVGAATQSTESLARVFENLLDKFAAAEARRGEELSTPRSVAQLLVEMVEPLRGRVFDPCCKSAGLLVAAGRFALTHGGRKTDLALEGQESSYATWRLAKMYLAVEGMDADLQVARGLVPHSAPELLADFVLAIPPFNLANWGGERLATDERWVYGEPPPGNANYAWIQHFLHHLAPRGIAGFVMPNGSVSSSQSREAEIRRAIIEADLVDCMVALPGQLFYTTGIPACLWLLARDRKTRGLLDRRGETLFLDARGLGTMIDRVRRELTVADIERLAGTYRAWRGDGSRSKYEDVPGFCKSESLAVIRQNGYLLSPGRYVGTSAVQEDEEPFEAKMKRLTSILRQQLEESRRLGDEIWKNLERLGYGET